MSTHGPVEPEDAHQEYVDRLRAADPARGAEPDMVALRAAVAARRAGGQVSDQLAARRSRRWIPVAAAAAAALVVGSGGGFAIGALRGDHETSVSLADGPAVAPGPADQAVGGAGSPGAEVQAQPPELAAGGGAATRGMGDASLGFYGRTVFTASGLSDQGTTAHVWAVDVGAVADRATVARVAAALGLDGAVQETGPGGFTVGPQDGSGPNLSIYPGGFGDVNYYDPAADPWRCDASVKTAEGTASAATPLPPDGGCAQADLGPAPTVDQATSRLMELLAALGVDAADVEPGEASDQGGWTYVSAYRVVGGTRTDLMWNATFTGGGLQSLSGSLAPLADLGSYPVISPAAAVQRLGDPRFGAGGGPIRFAADAQASVAPVPEPMGPTAPTIPPMPEPGSPLSWPVQRVSIVSAELALSTYAQPSGAVVVAPTYRLTGADGSVWSVVAVADDALSF
ncbi:hypothetical protein Q6348_05075 [Isoptericola sp. b441]|uniref:Uncharacterized protein n=1 Tax=Actinotalea lenta TaxID=3064654 RepID=A0ABT9D7Z1_9CELL|nr:hypothetical protein [Isoptericola sp. b441]MDO8106566.1 hypothetical protein [Isoptericola sp. b441]